MFVFQRFNLYRLLSFVSKYICTVKNSLYWWMLLARKCMCPFHEWLISISPCGSIVQYKSKLVVVNDCTAPAHDHNTYYVFFSFLFVLAIKLKYRTSPFLLFQRYATSHSKKEFRTYSVSKLTIAWIISMKLACVRQKNLRIHSSVWNHKYGW